MPPLCRSDALAAPGMLEPGTGGQAAGCQRAALPASGRAWGLCSWHARLRRTKEKTPAWYIPDIIEIRGTWYCGGMARPDGERSPEHAWKGQLGR